MAFEDRRDRFAALAFAAIIGGLLVLAVQSRQQDGAQDAHDSQGADRYTERAEQRISIECPELVGAARSECTSRIMAAAEDARRSQQDLEAQQAMARWSLWMTIAAFVSVWVAGLGIYYIRQTLDQTIKANQAAQAGVVTMRNEQRPWVLLGQIRAIYHNDHAVHGECVRFDILFQNFGASPAVSVGVAYNAWPESEGGGVYIRFGIREPSANAVVPPGFTFPAAPFYLKGNDIAAFWNREIRVVFDVLGRYSFPDGSAEAGTRYLIQCRYDGHDEQNDGKEYSIHLETTSRMLPEIT